MSAQNKNNRVTKLNDINVKGIEPKEYKSSNLLNYEGQALNLQLEPLTLTKYGLYPNKSLVEEGKYVDNKRFNVWIPFEDFTKENMAKLREFDTFFKNNEKFKKKCQIPESAKYNNLLNDNNGYVVFNLKSDYGSDNITTTFINKDDKDDISKNTELHKAYKYFKLGNTLQLIVTGSVYKYTSSRNNEMYWGVNLKLVTCKYTEIDKLVSADEEIDNAKAFFEMKSLAMEERDFMSLDVKKLTASLVVNKNTGENIPVLNFSDFKGTVHLRLPELVLSTYGTPADEFLRDGSKNKYFTGEKNRRSIKIPIPSEEKQVVAKFTELDKYIKNSVNIRNVASIDEDNVEKYRPIYRKPLKNKDPNAPVKPNYIKLKFNSKGDMIATKFFMNNKQLEVNTVNDLDNYLRLNMTLIPVVRFGSIYNQALGDWGATLQLVSLTLVPQSKGVVDFVDDMPAQDVDFDDEDYHEQKKPAKKVAKVDSDEDDVPVVKKKPVAKKVVSDDEEDAPVVKKKPEAKKQIAVVDSDEDDVPVVKKKPEAKKPIAVVDSDEEDIKPAKKTVAKGKKANV